MQGAFTLLDRSAIALLAALVNRLFSVHYTDLCYGYNAFWRNQIALLGLDMSGFEIETLINISAPPNAAWKVVEVPSFEAARLSGESKLNARRDGIRVLRTIVSERLRPR